jgi:hypothetical protein
MFDVTQVQWTHGLRQPVISDGLRQLGWALPALGKILPLLAAMQLWVWCLPNLSRMMRDYQLTPTALPENQRGWRWQPRWIWGLLTAGALAASLMALHDTGDFVYFQF